MANVQELLGLYKYQRSLSDSDERFLMSENPGQDGLLGGHASTRAIENVAVHSVLSRSDHDDPGNVRRALEDILNVRFGRKAVIIQYLQYEEPLACWRLMLKVPSEEFSWSLLFWSKTRLQAALNALVRKIALQSTMYADPVPHALPMVRSSVTLRFHDVTLVQLCVSRDAPSPGQTTATYSFTYGHVVKYMVDGTSINNFQARVIVSQESTAAK